MVICNKPYLSFLFCYYLKSQRDEDDAKSYKDQIVVYQQKVYGELHVLFR